LLRDDSELTQEASGRALAALYDSTLDPINQDNLNQGKQEAEGMEVEGEKEALRAQLLQELVSALKGTGDRTALEVRAFSYNQKRYIYIFICIIIDLYIRWMCTWVM
jgi:hypothetical protein